MKTVEMKVETSVKFLEGNLTMATVTMNGKEYRGVARRNPADKFNEEVGTAVALSRAFAAAAKAQGRLGSGLVKHYDDMRNRVEQKKNRPKAHLVKASAPTKLAEMRVQA
jgi:hypothetical protein